MTSAEANDKVCKLLALAAPGSGATKDEAATAARIANQICAKYGIRPSPPRPTSSSAGYVLPGQVNPRWAPPPPTNRGTGWWAWVGRSFGASEAGISGVTDAQARVMAIVLLSSGAYISANDMEIIESALNGLLTEYGKILLDGLYTLNT